MLDAWDSSVSKEKISVFMEHLFYREESNNEKRCSKQNDKGYGKKKSTARPGRLGMSRKEVGRLITSQIECSR